MSNEHHSSSLPDYLIKLGGHLSEYLQSHNIDPYKSFPCIDPSHADDNPSAHVFKGFCIKCHGCKKVFTIFDAAHFLEGLPPKHSPYYYEHNVLELARRFGITVDSKPRETPIPVIMQTIAYILETYLPKQAAIKGITSQELLHQWAITPEFIPLQDELPVVLEAPPFSEIEHFLLGQNFTRDQMFKASITPAMFQQGRLYPLWISPSICVGFAVRNNTEPRHLNSNNSNCFVKQSFLYNLYNIDPNEEVYIVEGVKDCLALRSQGFNAVATLTSNITPQQLEALLKRGVSSIIWCYDGDDAGRTGTLKAFEATLLRGFISNVCPLPDKEDPYSFLIDNNQLLSFPTDGLEWWCHQLIDKFGEALHCIDYIFEVLCAIHQKTKRTIISSEIEKVMMLQGLVQDCEVEYARRESLKESGLIKIYERAIEQAKANPSQVASILSEASQYANNYIRKPLSYDNQSLSEVLLHLQSPQSDLSKKDVHLHPAGLGVFSDLLHDGGIGYTESMVALIGGDPNTGKSAFLLQLAVEFLLGREDTMVVHFSTDDGCKILIPRIVSILVFDPFFAISDALKIHAPNTFLATAKQNAIEQLIKWCYDERLVSKDMEFSRLFEDCAQLVRYYREKYPHRTILVINDNMHQDDDYPYADDNKRIEMLTRTAKDLATKQRCSVWAAVEHRKNKAGTTGFGGTSDIAGGRGASYNANLIINLRNEEITNDGDLSEASLVFHYNGELLPRVAASIAKNKVSRHKGLVYLNFFTSSSFFTHVDKQTALAELRERQQYLKSIQPPKERYNQTRNKKQY